MPLGLERNAASRAKTGRYTWAMDEYRVEGRRRGRKEKRGNEKDTKGSVEARTRSSAFSSLTWIWKRGCGCRTRLAGNAACRCPGASFRRKPLVLLLKIASCPKLPFYQTAIFLRYVCVSMWQNSNTWLKRINQLIYFHHSSSWIENIITSYIT